MSKKVYKTALGKGLDIDMLRAQNENVIAVGNMHVNARGDELGPGGVIVRRREEIMKEYYTTGGGVVGSKKTPEPNFRAAAVNKPQQPVKPLEKELAPNHGPRLDMVRPVTVEDDEFLDVSESLSVNARARAEAQQQQAEKAQELTMDALGPNPTMTPRPRFRGSLAEGVAMRGTKDVFQEPQDSTKKGIRKI